MPNIDGFKDYLYYLQNRKSPSSKEDCPDCDGTGVFDLIGYKRKAVTCDTCDGEGKLPKDHPRLNN